LKKRTFHPEQLKYVDADWIDDGPHGQFVSFPDGAFYAETVVTTAEAEFFNRHHEDGECKYPSCKCPFDKGPDDKCFRRISR